MTLRIGIDVGGTNTDAVLMRGREVLSWAKRPTTPDVTSGIRSALQALLEAARVKAGEVGAVMLGTTHFTNAVVQRQGLARTAALRLGLPAAQSIPPLFDWPHELREVIGGFGYLLHGGHEYDGREISPLDESELGSVIDDLRRLDAQAVAITSVFSPVTPEHEQVVAERVRAELPGVELSLSSEVARLGLLERENAAILNACLAPVARRTVAAFRRALNGMGIEAPLYISQNDGTLMTAEHAERYPVLTFASGPTNSMRGAAFLSGVGTAVVVDIGGTTTDVGMLVKGFPREASLAIQVGGVRTNFRMPDLVSVGLGGGSLIEDDGRRVGPQSVGYELGSRALVFGGDTLTATDIAVAAGMAALGDRAKLEMPQPGTVEAALLTIRETLEQLVDSAKTSAERVPVVAVGGGSILVPDSLMGAGEVLKPPYYAVANAIGAAIAQVSGEVDRVYPMEGRGRDQVLGDARRGAGERAVAAGADPGTLEVVEVEEIPLAYLPSNALRVRVKVVGDLGE